MDVTALATIAGTAATAAGAGYGWRQAIEARRGRQVEEARRHSELEPPYDVDLEDMNGGGWHRLAVQLRGTRPVTGLQVTILDGPGASFTPNQWGVEAGKYPIWEARLPDDELPLGPGKTAHWRMEFDLQKTTGTMTLRLDGCGTDDRGRSVRWTRVHDCRTPAPSRHIY
jgi:hypothetical protein